MQGRPLLGVETGVFLKLLSCLPLLGSDWSGCHTGQARASKKAEDDVAMGGGGEWLSCMPAAVID